MIPATDGKSAAEHVLDRLLRYDHEPYDERWLLLDADHYTSGSHLRTFKRVMQNAANHGVRIAISKPCFEFWLLLHHADPKSIPAVSNAAETEVALRMALGSYNKASLIREHYPPETVCDAFTAAQGLEAGWGQGEIPLANGSRVYRLWGAIMQAMSEAQIPEPLRPLFDLARTSTQ